MKDLFNPYIQSIETYIMFRIKEQTASLTPELEKKGRKPIYLSMGAPTSKPPKFVIDKLVEALNTDSMHTYSSPRGEKFFLDAVETFMKNRFNVNIDAKTEVCSLLGSKEGIANLLRALINPSTDEKNQDIILLPDPSYASYKEMVKVSGGYGYSLPLTPENNYMPDLNKILENLQQEGFDKNKIKALILNYPSNPLGVVANRKYYESAIDFCKRNHILLISDVAYVETHFGNCPETPTSILTLPNAKDVVIEFYSFSKPFAMTGWRLGWACGNKDAVSNLIKMKSTIDSGVFKAIQKAGAELLNSKDGEEYIKWINLEFKRKREIIVKGLAELGWNGDNLPPATFYLWLPIPPKYDTAEKFAQDILEKSGIVIVPGTAFGKYGQGFFRISIVCSDDELLEVISRMKQDGFYFG